MTNILYKVTKIKLHLSKNKIPAQLTNKTTKFHFGSFRATFLYKYYPPKPTLSKTDQIKRSFLKNTNVTWILNPCVDPTSEITHQKQSVVAWM